MRALEDTPEIRFLSIINPYKKLKDKWIQSKLGYNVCFVPRPQTTGITWQAKEEIYQVWTQGINIEHIYCLYRNPR